MAIAARYGVDVGHGGEREPAGRNAQRSPAALEMHGAERLLSNPYPRRYALI